MLKLPMVTENSETTDVGDRSAQPPDDGVASERPSDESNDDVPAEDGSEDQDSERSSGFAAIVRLAFPTAALILAVLYVDGTYGRIRTENLYYPYFVIGLLLFFGATVYVDELRELYRRNADETFVESVRASVYEWRRSIGLVIVGVVYLMLIDVIGFFIASFLGIIGVMLVGGLRDPKTIAVGTFLILAFVHVLFIQLMGLQPPEGPLGL